MDTQTKEITEERYNDMMEVLPPIYINPSTVKQEAYSAFAVSEAYSHGKSVILTVCWKERQGQAIKFYERLMEVYTPAGKPIDETYGHYYGRSYKAMQVN